MYKYFTFPSVFSLRRKKKKINRKGTKDKFCAINYRDRPDASRKVSDYGILRAREKEGETGEGVGKEEEKKVDVPTLCHGPAEHR